jgi:hypothetical protein
MVFCQHRHLSGRGEGVMGKSLDRGEFWDLFKDRMVVLADVPAGRSRELAQQANEAGRQDTSLRTRAEFAALFDLLHGEAVSEPGMPN